jgi:hypothetical protein
MADDRTKRGGADRSRINLNQAYEVRDWCEKFGCTETQLREAVREVGLQASDVEAYLRSHSEASTGSQR